MFEELRALVGGSEGDVSVLDDYTDRAEINTVLTTDRTVDVEAPAVKNPADPLSGNRMVNGHWKFLRRVQIQKVANDPYVRQVTVKVFRYASHHRHDQAAHPGHGRVRAGCQ
jgi:hypothetical protein